MSSLWLFPARWSGKKKTFHLPESSDSERIGRTVPLREEEGDAIVHSWGIASEEIHTSVEALMPQKIMRIVARELLSSGITLHMCAPG